MSNDSNPIEAVRARLDGGRKWIKDELGDVEGDGPVCLVGADYSVVNAGLPRFGYDLLLEVIPEQYPDRLGPDGLGPDGFFVVSDFNNHPDTTWADVDLVLDKASVLWDERHGTTP